MRVKAASMSIQGAFSLERRRALVTGASRGLGQAIALALADAGADVVCAGTTADRCAETAEAIRDKGHEAWAIGGDLSDRAAVERLADEAESRAGRIDILVNNAGTIRRHPAAEFPTGTGTMCSIRTSMLCFCCAAISVPG